MPAKTDNESGINRTLARDYDENNQDGGLGSSNTAQKEDDVDYQSVITPSDASPKIFFVQGLTLVETDNNPITASGSSEEPENATKMKKLSRKKISDEKSFDEREPLKIPVLNAKGHSNRKKNSDRNMEDDSKMDDIDLRDEVADSPSLKDEEQEDSPQKAQKKDPSAAVQLAVDAFTQGVGPKNSYDLNKNSKLGEGDKKSHPKAVPFHISDKVERMDSFTIATRDDVDAGSVYSLFMEKDFRYHFQHPYFRLFCAYFVVFCNFLIYAEDPVAHSKKECTIPVIGNSLSFVGMKYPPNAWSLLKVLMWLSGIVVGIIVGKLFFHTYLFNRVFRLKMFTDDKGSWMITFLSTILFVFIFSYVYNLFLLIGEDNTEEYEITSFMGISNSIFMKVAATGTWCGDFFTAWMVTDMMMQERLYPEWAKPVRKWWNEGIRRIILFWIVVVLSSFIVIFVIATDYINWDSLNRDFLHSNEISRAFLASFILVLDIFIVMQDWDFPHFISAIDVKLPGVNAAHIRFKIPKLLKELDYWHVHISGKWFNYGILFIVIILDLNMWKNQIFYNPYDYGQYTDSDGRIFTVKDEYSLDNANRTTLTLEYRNSTINPLTNRTYFSDDYYMNARYNGYSLALKGLAFVPSLTTFLIFGILVMIYGRHPKPTKENPYDGRLKKRRRKRFSARKKWNSLQQWITESTPILTRFRRRTTMANVKEERSKRAQENEGNRTIEEKETEGEKTNGATVDEVPV